MATLEEKLEAIDDRFRNPSKGRDAARWIIQENRKMTSDDKKAICEAIPIKKGTLADLFTELKRMDLYPPKETDEVIEAPRPPLKEYATKEDFETLRNSINYLASLVGGEAPSNPDELASVMRGEVPLNPGESQEERDIEVIQPEEVFIQDASLTKASVWLTPKTQIYYDMAKQGAFFYYAGTQIEGPFIRFKGNLSDFFNKIVDDYFIRCYNADIGLKTWRGL